MRKIIIKLPDKRVKKFRLQREGWKSRRFLKAASLLFCLENQLLPKKRKIDPSAPYKIKEKTAIIIKEYVDSHFENINETLDSDNPFYLVFTASCFLENFISASTQKKYEKYNKNL